MLLQSSLSQKTNKSTNKQKNKQTKPHKFCISQFYISEVLVGFIDFSALNFIKPKSRCQPTGLFSRYSGKTVLLTCSGYWQNPGPCSFRTFHFLLSVNWQMVLAPRGFSLVLEYGNLYPIASNGALNPSHIQNL